MSAVFSRARCEPAARTTNAQRSVSMDWCKGVSVSRGVPCRARRWEYANSVPLLPRRYLSSGGAEARPPSRKFVLHCSRPGPRSQQRCTAIARSVRARVAQLHLTTPWSPAPIGTAETPPTSTKPTTKTTMSCEAMGAAHSIAWSPLAPGAAAGRPPSPLAETAGGAARLATTRQADATISECCTRGCTLCFLSGHVELRPLHLPFLQD